MNRAFLSLAALSVGVAPAMAADLYSQKSPSFVAPAAPMWTGFHVGLNGGYTFANSTQATIVGSPIPPPPALFFPPNPVPPADAFAFGATARLPHGGASGFIGGGQLGYSWLPVEQFLIGAEADFQGVVGGPGSSTTITPSTTFITSNRLDYLGTVRARVGWLAIPTLLLYGTGGVAYGGASSATAIYQPGVGFAGGYGHGSTQSTRIGWTAGGGGEWMFLPNWSARAEYLYYDLGSTHQTLIAATEGLETAVGMPLVDPVQRFPYITARTDVAFSGHVVRAGLNYHFNWNPSLPRF